MNFAGAALKGLLKDAIGAVKPSGWADAAMDFGPDFAFAAMAGSRAAPGWALPLAGEELATGLGYSLAGRILGDTVGRRAFKLNPDVAEDLQKLQQFRMAGSMGVSIPLSVLGPRPVLDAMIKEQTAQQPPQQQETEQQLLEAGFTEDIMGNQLINAMINAGALTSRSLSGSQIPGMTALM